MTSFLNPANLPNITSRSLTEDFPRIEVYEYGIEGMGYSTPAEFKDFRKRKENNNLTIHKGISTKTRVGFNNKSVYYNFSKSLDPIVDAENELYGNLMNTPTKLNPRNFYMQYLLLTSKIKSSSLYKFNQFYDLPKRELIIDMIKKAIKKQYNYLKNNLMTNLGNNTFILKNLFKETDEARLVENIHYLHNGAFVYNIKLEPGEKVILFGDFHGSFHTFIRHLFRLHVLGVLDLSKGKYKINDGYRIIFLGDLIDRGNFGLEIIYILSRLIVENNTKDKLKLILNRGNHENIETFSYFGFRNEYKHKLGENTTIKLNESSSINLRLSYLFMLFFNYMSSAIILQKDRLKYWCCHGGFPLEGVIINSSQKIVFEGVEYNRRILTELTPVNFNFLNNNNICFLPEDEDNLPKQIRWNDFTSNNDTSFNTSRLSILFYNIGINHMKEFLQRNNIQMIIRGHQDSYFNSWLLCNSQIAKTNKSQLTSFDPLFNRNEDFVYNLSKIALKSTIHPMSKQFLYENNEEINNFLHKNIFDSIPTDVIMNGSIATINGKLKKWGNEFEKRFSNNDVFYPVLTISTNTDVSRIFTKDSFILLRFDGRTPNRNNMIINSLFNRNSFRHNINNVLVYNQSEESEYPSGEEINVTNNAVAAAPNSVFVTPTKPPKKNLQIPERPVKSIKPQIPSYMRPTKSSSSKPLAPSSRSALKTSVSKRPTNK